jgi:hypothetical protein
MKLNRQPCLKLAGSVVAAIASNNLVSKSAHAQLLGRYFPANIPAYQDFGANASISQADEGYAPLGVRAGDFVLSPSLEEDIGYDTAPFGGRSGSASAVAQTGAALGAVSDWSRNAVQANISVSNAQYLNLGKSITDWNGSVGATIEQSTNRIDLGFSYINAVTLPTDLGSFGQTSPVLNQNEDLRASYTLGTGHITLVPAIVGDIYTFSFPIGSTQGPPSGNLFDRDALTASLTANYEFAGGHNLVALLSDSVVSYGGHGSAQRPANYTDASFLVGVEYPSSALLTYRALVGYEERIPTGRGTTNTTLAAPAAELDVIWKPTVLTTLTGQVSQSFQNTPTETAQGLSETSVQLTLAHSLSRSVEVNAAAQLIRATFPNVPQVGGGSELSVQASMTANVHLSRHIVVSAEYIFNQSSGSNTSTLSYQRHQIFLRARLQW